MGLRLRLAVSAAALVIGIGVGVGIALRSGSGGSSGEYRFQTWKAGERLAPAFSLHDQHGKPVSLADVRGRPLLLTFLDPVCRDFCPREASVIAEVAAKLEPTPAIISISVNPWQNTAQNFADDAVHWKLPPDWRWGAGTRAELAAVWADYYVAVRITTQVIAGVTLRKVTHSGATYVIDSGGSERALLLWPFTTAQLLDAAKPATG